MKRLSLSFIGFVILFTPVTAGAEGPAISAYVRQVLERADKGIAYAKQGSAVQDFLEYYLPWSQSAGSTVLSLVDTKLRIVAQQRDLPENTACLRVDLYLIEKKIEQVRGELQQAIKDKKIMTIVRLQDLILFLNERFEHVLKGSRDPLYQDKTWWQRRLFEPEKTGWCCSGKKGDTCNERKATACSVEGGIFRETGEECAALGCRADPGVLEIEKICPFHSNYLPPSVTAGYGCDLTALQNIIPKVSPGALASSNEAEKDAVQKVATTLDNIVTRAESFLKLQIEIDELLGRETDLPDSVPPRSHKEIEGCVPTGDQLWKSGAVEWELRSNFSFEKDEQKILKAFQELRLKQGGRRSPPEEFMKKASKGLLDSMLDDYGRITFKRFSEKQGQLEAEVFAQASDTHLSVANTVDLLVTSVGTLSDLARSREGLRGFVRDYAYFLRRTCIHRPCNARLGQVLKIVFTDECFAYTNGDYLNDTCENPRWKKCMEKALGVNVKVDVSKCK
ncbi:hypothetical protein HYZ99_03735 [Candidatus Peregrinibacteria bacterium]|nr:hypothetical protein [Candidatus Peregrinibacteria bacterium]